MLTGVRELLTLIWQQLQVAAGLPVALAVAAFGGLALAAWLWARLRPDQPDPTWRPSKLNQTYTGYDKTKADAGVRNALERQRARMQRRQR